MMDMCCGVEVKGEGYILNLILYDDSAVSVPSVAV